MLTLFRTAAQGPIIAALSARSKGQGSCRSRSEGEVVPNRRRNRSREQGSRAPFPLTNGESASLLGGQQAVGSGPRRGGQRKEGKGQREEGRGQREEGRGKREEGRGKKAEGRRQRKDGRRQRKDGKRRRRGQSDRAALGFGLLSGLFPLASVLFPFPSGLCFPAFSLCPLSFSLCFNLSSQSVSEALWRPLYRIFSTPSLGKPEPSAGKPGF
jgi:hypothetical protein